MNSQSNDQSINVLIVSEKTELGSTKSLELAYWLRTINQSINVLIDQTIHSKTFSQFDRYDHADKQANSHSIDLIVALGDDEPYAYAKSLFNPSNNQSTNQPIIVNMALEIKDVLPSIHFDDHVTVIKQLLKQIVEKRNKTIQQSNNQSNDQPIDQAERRRYINWLITERAKLHALRTFNQSIKQIETESKPKVLDIVAEPQVVTC